MNKFQRYLCVACGAALLAGGASASTYTNERGEKIECTDQTVTKTETRKGHPVAGALAGAVVGGVVGHQFGSGRGNDVATVAGAGAGAAIGHNAAKGKTETETTTQTNCHPVQG